MATIFIGFYYFYKQTLNRIGSTRFNQILNVKTYKDLENIDLRFTLYRSTFEVGLNNISILGSGVKTFGHVVFEKSKAMEHNFSKYGITSLRTEYHKTAYNSHNALLTIWIEMGLLGLTASLLFLWLWIKPSFRGPPIIVIPIMSMCIGQIFDYFVWQILFMAFQSFFFVSFASKICLVRENKKLNN